MSVNDYELEAMESSAMKKSDKFKKAAVVGAAVVGAGGTVAYGADKIINPDSSDQDARSEGITGLEDTVKVDETVMNEEQTAAAAPASQDVHVYHHNVEPEPEVQAQPDVHVDESTVVFDENGDVEVAYDEGHINGKSFIVMDSDGDGVGDVMGYDANGNHIYEAHEIVDISDLDYRMGQGMHTTAIFTHESEDSHIYYAEEDDNIRNDFLDEKSGEVYRHDLADNNQDYNNRYAAGGQEEIEERVEVTPDDYDDKTYAYDDDVNNSEYGMPATEDDIYNDADAIDDYGLA